MVVFCLLVAGAGLAIELSGSREVSHVAADGYVVLNGILASETGAKYLPRAYTFYANDSGEQMFDLRADPDEQVNLVADPAYAEIRQELRDRLLELIVMQDYPKTRRELFALGVHYCPIKSHLMDRNVS